MEKESSTVELERYKERDRNAKFIAFQKEIDKLTQDLSKHAKEKEYLSTKFTVFKTESKEKESKSNDKEIALEKKNKELNNTISKMFQSTQTLHMITKPQVYYDNAPKQALGYQNPFYLKKAQRIKPTLYDGNVITKQHNVVHVIDDEEALILKEESRSKISEKLKDPEAIKKKVNPKQIDYVKLNQLSEDFGKYFVPQMELSAELAYWLPISNPKSEHLKHLLKLKFMLNFQK
ncbi:hypothetical protein Tco_0807372 [Tanacetum coccineum]